MSVIFGLAGYPGRAVIQIATDGIANGGGTIHCATQQQIWLIAANVCRDFSEEFSKASLVQITRLQLRWTIKSCRSYVEG